MFQEFVIVGVNLAQTFDQAADGGCLRDVEALILQIEVVDNLSDAHKCGASDAKTPQKRLNRAGISFVTQLDAEHVKRDSAGNAVRPFGERKFCIGIDEPPD